MAGRASPTRQSSRERVQTPKARELNRRQLRMESSDTEDAIEVVDTIPAAPQPKRTEISTHLRGRITTTKVQALAAKADRSAAATSNYASQEKGTTNAQIKALTDLVKSLIKAMEDQKQTHQNQIEALMETMTKTVTQQIDTLKAEVADIAAKTEEIQTQLSSIQFPSPSPSYAEVARTPPNSWPSNIQTLTSMGTTPSRMTDTLYCTIDTSRVGEEDKNKAQPGPIRKAVEEEIRTTEGQDKWRCAAVIRDGRNAERIKIACRDEAELQRVKEAAQKVAAEGARVLRDQLYPVKVDNANRSAVLDAHGKVLPGAAEVLGKENDVNIAKIAWLSRRDEGKAYGSMVVYVTKGSDAARLLQDQYFHLAGESAYTSIFEPRYGPKQCYRCQELGHKAFSCSKPQTCARCAAVGHHHSECQATIPKCVPCGGPHESFSRKCRVLYPAQNE
jgi:Zinc knuckle